MMTAAETINTIRARIDGGDRLMIGAIDALGTLARRPERGAWPELEQARSQYRGFAPDGACSADDAADELARRWAGARAQDEAAALRIPVPAPVTLTRSDDESVTASVDGATGEIALTYSLDCERTEYSDAAVLASLPTEWLRQARTKRLAVLVAAEDWRTVNLSAEDRAAARAALALA